jgi:hypothetical protein
LGKERVLQCWNSQKASRVHCEWGLDMKTNRSHSVHWLEKSRDSWLQNLRLRPIARAQENQCFRVIFVIVTNTALEGRHRSGTPGHPHGQNWELVPDHGYLRQAASQPHPRTTELHFHFHNVSRWPRYAFKFEKHQEDIPLSKASI